MEGFQGVRCINTGYLSYPKVCTTICKPDPMCAEGAPGRGKGVCAEGTPGRGKGVCAADEGSWVSRWKLPGDGVNGREEGGWGIKSCGPEGER